MMYSRSSLHEEKTEKRANETEEAWKERLTRRNQLDRARRVAETEDQKEERLEKRRERRNEMDSLRREAKLRPKRGRLEKRRERKIEAETEQRRERKNAMDRASRARRQAKKSEEKREVFLYYREFWYSEFANPFGKAILLQEYYS